MKAHPRKATRRVVYALALTALAQGAPAGAQLAPRRSTDLVTLYATNGISGSCSLPGDSMRRTLAVSHRRDLDGNVVPFTVPAGQKLVITNMEYRVVTDAAKDLHVAIYSSTPGSSYFGHPMVTSPTRSDDQGAGVGVAIGSADWQPGIVLPAGQRPCFVDALGSLIWKDPESSPAHGFTYVLLHGYLTTR